MERKNTEEKAGPSSGSDLIIITPDELAKLGLFQDLQATAVKPKPKEFPETASESMNLKVKNKKGENLGAKKNFLNSSKGNDKRENPPTLKSKILDKPSSLLSKAVSQKSGEKVLNPEIKIVNDGPEITVENKITGNVEGQTILNSKFLNKNLKTQSPLILNKNETPATLNWMQPVKNASSSNPANSGQPKILNTEIKFEKRKFVIAKKKIDRQKPVILNSKQIFGKKCIEKSTAHSVEISNKNISTTVATNIRSSDLKSLKSISTKDPNKEPEVINSQVSASIVGNKTPSTNSLSSFAETLRRGLNKKLRKDINKPPSIDKLKSGTAITIEDSDSELDSPNTTFDKKLIRDSLPFPKKVKSLTVIENIHKPSEEIIDLEDSKGPSEEVSSSNNIKKEVKIISNTAIRLSNEEIKHLVSKPKIKFQSKSPSENTKRVNQSLLPTEINTNFILAETEASNKIIPGQYPATKESDVSVNTKEKIQPDLPVTKIDVKIEAENSNEKADTLLLHSPVMEKYATIIEEAKKNYPTTTQPSEKESDVPLTVNERIVRNRKTPPKLLAFSKLISVEKGHSKMQVLEDKKIENVSKIAEKSESKLKKEEAISIAKEDSKKQVLQNKSIKNISETEEKSESKLKKEEAILIAKDSKKQVLQNKSIKNVSGTAEKSESKLKKEEEVFSVVNEDSKKQVLQNKSIKNVRETTKKSESKLKKEKAISIVNEDSKKQFLQDKNIKNVIEATEKPDSEFKKEDAVSIVKKDNKKQFLQNNKVKNVSEIMEKSKVLHKSDKNKIKNPLPGTSKIIDSPGQYDRQRQETGDPKYKSKNISEKEVESRKIVKNLKVLDNKPSLKESSHIKMESSIENQTITLRTKKNKKNQSLSTEGKKHASNDLCDVNVSPKIEQRDFDESTMVYKQHENILEKGTVNMDIRTNQIFCKTEGPETVIDCIKEDTQHTKSMDKTMENCDIPIQNKESIGTPKMYGKIQKIKSNDSSTVKREEEILEAPDKPGAVNVNNSLENFVAVPKKREYSRKLTSFNIKEEPIKNCVAESKDNITKISDDINKNGPNISKANKTNLNKKIEVVSDTEQHNSINIEDKHKARENVKYSLISGEPLIDKSVPSQIETNAKLPRKRKKPTKIVNLNEIQGINEPLPPLEKNYEQMNKTLEDVNRENISKIYKTDSNKKIKAATDVEHHNIISLDNARENLKSDPISEKTLINKSDDSQVETSKISTDTCANLPKKKGRPKKIVNLKEVHEISEPLLPLEKHEQNTSVESEDSTRKNQKHNLTLKESLINKLDDSQIETSKADINTSVKITKKRGRPKKIANLEEIQEVKEPLPSVATNHEQMNTNLEYEDKRNISKADKAESIEKIEVATNIEHHSTISPADEGRTKENEESINKSNDLKVNASEADIDTCVKHNLTLKESLINKLDDSQIETSKADINTSVKTTKKRGRPKKIANLEEIQEVKEPLPSVATNHEQMNTNLEYEDKRNISKADKAESIEKIEVATNIEHHSTISPADEGRTKENEESINKSNDLKVNASEADIDTCVKLPRKRGRPKKIVNLNEIQEINESLPPSENNHAQMITSTPLPKKRGRKRKSEIIDNLTEDNTEPVILDESRSGRKRKRVNYFQMENSTTDDEEVDQKPRKRKTATKDTAVKFPKPYLNEGNKTDGKNEDSSQIISDANQLDEIVNQKDDELEQNIKNSDNEMEKKTENTTITPVLNGNDCESGKDLKETDETNVKPDDDKKQKRYRRKKSSVMINSMFAAAVRNNTKSDLGVEEQEVGLSDTTVSTCDFGTKEALTPKIVIDEHNMVTCTACKNKINNDEWDVHNRNVHYCLAWREGDQDLNLDDKCFVTQTLIPIMEHEKELKCHKCEKTYNQVRSFIKHMKKCNGIVPQSDSVTCAVCKLEIQKRRWALHKQKKHNNLAWRIGDPPLDLNNKTLVLSILNALYKAKKPIICEKCGISKKSVVGYLSHQAQCGVKAMEAQVECEICGKRLLPVSMPSHIKMIHETPKISNIAQTTDYFSIDHNAITSKRQAAKRAMLVMDRFSKEKIIQEYAKHFLRNIEFKEENFVIPLLQKELIDNSKVKCKFNGCTFETEDGITLVDHMDSCEHKPDQYYTCKKCLLIYDTEEEIKKHIKETYNIDIIDDDFKMDDNNEDLEDDSEQDEEETLSKDPIKKKKIIENNRLQAFTATRIKHPHLYDVGEKKPGTLFPRAFSFTMDFCEEFLSKPLLFDHLRYWDDDWDTVHEDKVRSYLPKCEFSCDVAWTKSNTFENVLGNDYTFKKFELFEAVIDEGIATIFCGGPIHAMAWMPTPYNSLNSKQILAVAPGHHFDGDYQCNKWYNEPTVIQFWDFGVLRNNEKMTVPKVRFHLAVDFGPVWHLEWCPSGCYDSTEDNGDETALARMGLLAAAGSDAIVHIYAIPFLYEDDEESLLEVKKPLLKLFLTPRNAKGIKNEEFYAVKISWSMAAGHKYIAVGYSDGMVALFNISTDTSLLDKDYDGADILTPIRILAAHQHYISVLHLLHYEDGKRWLLTGSYDREVFFWDLDKRSNETIPKKCIVSDGVWLTNWLSYVIAYDDSTTSCPVHAILRSFRDNMCDRVNITISNTTIKSISSSNWLNGIIQGNTAGEIVAVFPHSLFSIESEKHMKCYKYLFGCVKLINKSKSPEERVAEEIEIQKALKNVSEDDSESANIGNRPNNIFGPITYNGGDTKYGILFCDKIMDQISDFFTTENQPKYGTESELYRFQPYPMRRINKIAFNPNRQASLYYATGYEIGFVRVTYMKFWENDPHLNK